MTRAPQENGFSLIELSIVLVVGGILLSGFLQYYSVTQQQKRYDITKQHLRDIRTALTHYVILNGHLPCPANPAGEYSADDCAKADAEPAAGVERHKSDPKNPAKDSRDEVWTGIVPVRELRLERAQIQDGWGNLVTYAVSRRLTLPNGMRGNPLPLGVMSLVDEKGESVAGKTGTSRYALISHGPTGAGAWVSGGGGGRKPCAEGTLDGRNCTGGTVFVVAPVSEQPGENFYDDIVMYDDLSAGGALVDLIAVCNARQAFYDPANPYADQEGCIMSRKRLR